MLPGARVGRLVVLEEDAPRKGKRYVRVQCDCGQVRRVAADNLRRGDHTRSCGCFARELAVQRPLTHGHAAHPHRSAEYNCWCSMRARCYCPKTVSYRYYGARGITVCQEWIALFEAFLQDMGPKPSPQHSIERLDNDGPYAPWNCVWATPAEQARNRRRLR